MRLRSLCLALLLLAAAPAAAVVKVYDATPPHGTPGDNFTFNDALCPPVQIRPGIVWGHYTISDTGSGTVTVTEHSQEPTTVNLFDIETIFGPGAYVFIDARSTVHPALPYTGVGSTAPSGAVDWGVLGGWTQTGFVYCASSPTTICAASAGTPHATTSPLGPMPSPTYDMGTWSFDSAGDMEGVPYISRTNLGGTSNEQSLVRGLYVGGSVPALPLVGIAALAAGIATAGARAALRRR
ncbi:MAG: hypothetical protein R3E88_16175 [Myxococcota bacterium]